MRIKLNWAILGTSHISNVLAEAIKSSTSGNLLAIGSRTKITAQTFSRKFSIPYIYSDYHSLLQDPKIDAVYIGLPNHLHKEWIIKCAQAGKHILSEKPLVLNQCEMDEVRHALEKNKVVCMEAIMYRYHPFTEKIKKVVQEEVGEIRHINATYTANIASVANPTAGGAIRNLGCYPLSLVNYLQDSPVVNMHAMGRLCPLNQADRQSTVLLSYANKSTAVITTADDMDMQWHLSIHGNLGKIEMISNPWMPDVMNHLTLTKNDNIQNFYFHADKPLYTYQVDKLHHDVENDLHDSINETEKNIHLLAQWREKLF